VTDSDEKGVTNSGQGFASRLEHVSPPEPSAQSKRVLPNEVSSSPVVLFTLALRFVLNMEIGSSEHQSRNPRVHSTPWQKKGSSESLRRSGWLDYGVIFLQVSFR
jgi:hypothetical protein